MAVQLNLTSLLGYRLHNRFIQDFIAGIEEKPELSDWEDRMYYKFKKSGFSLLFERQWTLFGRRIAPNRCVPLQMRLFC